MKLDIQLFGGRGSSSSSSRAGGNSNKYAGRFSNGTPEQLQQAKRNLNFNIDRLTETVASQEYGNKIARGQFKEQLRINKNTLKELKLQQKELKNEFKRRNIKY